MSEVRLVGTAHVSAESVDDVRREIDEFVPDIVAIELDPGRYHVLKYGAVLAQGTAAEIRANQDVIDAYLGSDHHLAEAAGAA